MTRWIAPDARWGALVLLLLVAAAIPDAGLKGVGPAGSSPSAVDIAPDPADELPGLVADHPFAGPLSAPTGDMAPPEIGELASAVALSPSGPTTYVPILLYHYIRVNPNPRDRVGFGLSTPPVAFRAQMQYLADHGFHVIPLHQAVVAIQHHSALPSRPIVLTFDDGYADFFTAAVPILKSHGFTATSFVISVRMGWGGFMTPSQVATASGMGFTIGAHTVDHVALAAQTPARATWEMKQSKLALEQLLGHPVVDFAYPYGSFNQYDMAKAKNLGFETACSTMYGTAHSAGQLYELSRMRIGGGLPLTYFAGVVGGPPPTAAELRGAGSPPASLAPSATPRPSPTPAPTPSPSPSPSATASALSWLVSLSP